MADSEMTATASASDPFHLDFGKVQAEVVAFEGALKETKESWQEESLKYEESIKVKIDGKSMTVPRRNYANSRETVSDQSLYPYDDCFYPLLNAYDCLYEALDFHPIESDARRPFAVPVPLRVALDAPDSSVDAYMPVTCAAIVASLLPEVSLSSEAPEEAFSVWTAELSATFHPDGTYDGTYDGTETLLPSGTSVFVRSPRDPDIINDATTTSVSAPLRHLHRPELLLKLLRHSMSDLQRDHRLSATVIMRLTMNRALDDINVMRRVLAILDSNYVVCGDPCDAELESYDHVCQNWLFATRGRLREMFSLGLTSMTESHTISLVAFVRSTFQREYGYLLPDSDEVDFETRRKTLLKRTIVSLRAEEADDATEQAGDGIPDIIVGSIVVALGSRVSIERSRLLGMQEDPSVSSELVATTLDSYSNCVLALVEIGRMILLLLPGTERFYGIASEVVKSLTMAYVDFGDAVKRQGYLGIYRDDRLVCPLRYSSSLTRRKSPAQLPVDVSLKKEQHLDQIVSRPPPPAVAHVVKFLFLKELVDHRISGMGYGDFLLWTGLEVSPLDPLLFWPEYAYPAEESESDSEDDGEEEEDEIQWDLDDQQEDFMGMRELRACHDFTLLALVRAWHAPWQPESHMSFQPGFRDAVKALSMCSRHCGMPNEVGIGIASFLRRDWWPDSRVQCWSYDCQLEQLRKTFKHWLVEHKGGPAAATKKALGKQIVLDSCPQCGVAKYCSKECREQDYKAGHKKMCCRPPFRTDDVGDSIFLREILGHDLPPLLKDRRVVDSCEACEVEDIESQLGSVEGDDESWESFDSDQDDAEASTTRSQKIQQYFEKHAYNRLRMK